MARKLVVICEMCGGTKSSGGADFTVFHCLAFCSPDCRDDYRSADEERRARKEALPSPASASSHKRPRAA